MKPMDVFEKMAILDDDLIDAATLPEVAAAPAEAGGLRHRFERFIDFMNRPAVVAAACVLVSFGVLAGIIAAGRMGGDSKGEAGLSPENGMPDRPLYGGVLDGTEARTESVAAEETFAADEKLPSEGLTNEDIGVDQEIEGENSPCTDGPGSSAGIINPPAEDVSEPVPGDGSSAGIINPPAEDVSEPVPGDGEDPELVLPDVMPSVPTVVIKVAAGNKGTNLHQYVVAYSGTVMTADGQMVSMEMDGMSPREQPEDLAWVAAIRYEGALTVTLPLSCSPRDWVMYNEEFVVLDQSDNLDKLPDAVALMKGSMEGAESHYVYIVLAVDYKYGDDRGLFEYAFRVRFGDEEETTFVHVDTTPVYPDDDTVTEVGWATEAWPEEDSTIASEGWAEDAPETDRPTEETKVSWEDDKVITPDETLKMIADGERSVYPYAHLVYAGSRDESTGKWVSDSRPTFDRWAPENAPNYMNELPVLTWQGGELKLALRFEDRMTVKLLAVYYPDLTYIDTVYDAADLKAFGWGQYLVIAEVHRQETDEEFIYQHVFILERE